MHDGQGAQANHKGVFDGAACHLEGRTVAFQGIAWHKCLAGSFSERLIQDINLRQERNTYYAISKDVDKNAERPFCLFALDGMKGVHGEGKSVGCALLYKKHHCGDENGDYGGGTGKAVIAPAVSEKKALYISTGKVR